MPLKIDDLKTVETYKRAIKLDLNKIAFQGKTKFWVYKDIELPTASGGKQKLPVVISLVDDVAVKAVLKGKQPVCQGTCGFDSEGRIGFQAAQGKVPYEVLAKSIPLLLGKVVHVPSGAEMDPENTAPPATAPAQHGNLNAAWKQLTQKAAERAKAHPAEHGKLAQALADINKLLQGGQLPEAEKRMAHLHASLQAPPASQAPPSAPAIPPQASAAPQQSTEPAPQARFRGEPTEWPKAFTQQEWAEAFKPFMAANGEAIRLTLRNDAEVNEVRQSLAALHRIADAVWKDHQEAYQHDQKELDRHLWIFFQTAAKRAASYHGDLSNFVHEIRKKAHKRSERSPKMTIQMVLDGVPTFDTVTDVSNSHHIWQNVWDGGNGAPPLNL